MFEPADSYAIARIDQPEGSTHGWQVRLQRRGVKYGKYFGDRSHGGRAAAYDAARSWRNKLIARLDHDDAVRVCRRSPRNSSGVVGVCRVAVSAANGEKYFFWQATWSPEPGVRRCVKYSVRRHGDSEAFALAVRARRRGIEGKAGESGLEKPPDSV